MHAVAAVLSILALTPAEAGQPARTAKEVPAMAMTIASSAFKHEAALPSRYTCDGSNVSPPLSFSGAPAATKSFALVVTDPDAPDPKAPRMTWVHWVLYDLPAGTTGLGEAISKSRRAPGSSPRCKGTSSRRRT